VTRSDVSSAGRTTAGGSLWLLITAVILLAAGYLILPRLVLAYTSPGYFSPASQREHPVNISATTCRTPTNSAHIAMGMQLDMHTTFPQPSTSICTTTYACICSDGADAIRDLLHDPISFDLGGEGGTLSQFTSLLEDELQQPVQIDSYLINEFNIEPNEPPLLLGTYKNLPAASVISRTLATYGELPLTVVVRDNLLLITEKTFAEQNYLATRLYPLPFDDNYQGIIDTIQQTVAPTSWNIVGGSGAIMLEVATGGLVISTTYEIHEQIEQLLATREKLLGIEHGVACTRVYTIMDSAVLTELVSSLAITCNQALGDLADPAAEVSSRTHRLIVRSTSRPFICYAQQLVRAYVGIEQPSPMGGNMMSMNAVSRAGPGGMSGGVF
jgi:hypothetical protein